MNRPFIVSLDKVPPEGLRFCFTSSSKEWTENLKDLLSDNAYQILLNIQPMNSSSLEFHITGSIQTNLNLTCARCAVDFQYKIDKEISEKIYIQPKKTKEEIDIPFNANQEMVTVLSYSHFDLFQFVHELIAIEEPMRPLGKSSCDLNDECENLISIKKDLSPLQTEEDSLSESDTKTQRPFADLDKFL